MIRAEVAVVPDAEAVARRWLRAAGGPWASAVYFAPPQSAPTLYVCLALIGGTVEHELPVSYPAFQFDVWARDNRKRAAGAAAWFLVGLLRAVAAEAVTLADGSGAVIDAATVTMGPLWRPDGDAGMARYIVDASLSLRPAT